MAASIPFVASKFPIIEELVERYRCGVAVDPDVPEDIAEAIDALSRHTDQADRMGAAGFAAIHADLNWSHEVAALINLYKQLSVGSAD
jgi:glycosyltransferase involved in cell wall biosynthesis